MDLSQPEAYDRLAASLRRAAYVPAMRSLDRLLQRRWRQMLPGHGDTVPDPAARLTELVRHRRTREAEVLAELARAPGTAALLAQRIYTTTPAALLPAASRNVLAHLIDLSDRNMAIPEGPITAATQFSAHCARTDAPQHLRYQHGKVFPVSAPIPPCRHPEPLL